ncbi:ABC transporter substrate-binding protein [Undibacterium sp. Di27W]|uniref:ABC transporter substrate-binding protein n=1 Tax=Undibacterium sp. Di27W TaxID=3413036 RepID=UPI003BF5459C
MLAQTMVTDMAGRQVSLPAKVNRIVLGEGRLFYALALLEGKKPIDRLVGWQGDFRLLDPQSFAQYRRLFPAIEQISLIGKTTENTVSAEKVLALKPDIVILSISGHGPSTHNEIVTQLQAAKVPVLFVDFRNAALRNTIPSLRLMGKALQREEQAEKFIRFYEDNLKKVSAVVSKIPENKKPHVFVDLRAGMIENITSAGNTGIGEFVTAAGGINIATPWLKDTMGEVNMEHLLAQQPALYMATGTGAPQDKAGVKMGSEVQPEQALASLQVVAHRLQLSRLNAVKNNQVFGAWHHFYVTPYHMALLQAMAKWQHPGLFEKLDPQQTWRDMHQQFLAIEPGGTFWIEAQARQQVPGQPVATLKSAP